VRIKQAGIYARISTNEERQHLQNQLDACVNFIGDHEPREWALPGVDRVYTDCESGGKLNRPGLRRALQDAALERIQVLVVFDLSRLTREGPGRAFEIIQRLHAHGCDFVSVTQPHFRTTGIAGDLLIAIAAYVAGEERRAIRDRVQAGLKRAREAGVILGRPTEQIDPAALMRLKGEGLSVRAIARALNCSKSTIERRMKKL